MLFLSSIVMSCLVCHALCVTAAVLRDDARIIIHTTPVRVNGGVNCLLFFCQGCILWRKLTALEIHDVSHDAHTD